MVDIPTVRHIAQALAGVSDASDDHRLVFEFDGKAIAWSYLVRVDPKKPRQPRLDVLAIRCPLEKKEMLIEAAPDRFFDDDHYRGYPSVLVRLEVVEPDELRALLEAACVVKRPQRRRGA